MGFLLHEGPDFIEFEHIVGLGWKPLFTQVWQCLGFFYPACNGQAINAKSALQTTDAGAFQVGTQDLLTNFLRVRLLRVEAAVAPASLAFVFLPSRAGEPITLELIATTIRTQMFDFFD